MYFQAETNGIKYDLSVEEQRDRWSVRIKEEGKDWVEHQILKSDYQSMDETISFIYKNKSYLVDVFGQDTDYTVYTRNSYRAIKIYNEQMLLHESLKRNSSLGKENQLVSGMPGKVLKLMVKKGSQIKQGDPLLIMEAMKMENEMRASRDATIEEVHVQPGDNIEGGALLITFT